jgi:hypothetical protein
MPDDYRSKQPSQPYEVVQKAPFLRTPFIILEACIVITGNRCSKMLLSRIDVIGFGRQPSSYHRAFQDAFHTHSSGPLYLHSPIGAFAGEAVWRERPMMLKLLKSPWRFTFWLNLRQSGQGRPIL